MWQLHSRLYNFDNYGKGMHLSLDKFKREVSRWRHKWLSVEEGILGILQTFVKTLHFLWPSRPFSSILCPLVLQRAALAARRGLRRILWKNSRLRPCSRRVRSTSLVSFPTQWQVIKPSPF